MQTVFKLFLISFLLIGCEFKLAEQADDTEDPNGERSGANRGLDARVKLENEKKIPRSTFLKEYEARTEQLSQISIGTSIQEETKISKIETQSGAISRCSFTQTKTSTVIKIDGFYVHMLEQYRQSNIIGNLPELCADLKRDEIVIKNLNEELKYFKILKSNKVNIYRGFNRGQVRYSLAMETDLIIDGKAGRPVITYLVLNPNQSIFHNVLSEGYRIKGKSNFNGVQKEFDHSTVKTLKSLPKVDTRTLDLRWLETRYEKY